MFVLLSLVRARAAGDKAGSVKVSIQVALKVVVVVRSLLLLLLGKQH